MHLDNKRNQVPMTVQWMQMMSHQVILIIHSHQVVSKPFRSKFLLKSYFVFFKLLSAIISDIDNKHKF